MPIEDTPLIPEEVGETPIPEPAEPMLPEPEDITPRLAADFITLTEEFPHLNSPTDLPDSVLDTAAQENIPLLDAYLRYRWQEEKKVAASLQTRQQAAMRSAGSLSRGAEGTPPEQDAFLRAFRSAL
ncbi:MAG: hypothetical protein IIX28_03710 [Clostridia bacterium]|nr:hypothetical protein [Clostridia bacterium]